MRLSHKSRAVLLASTACATLSLSGPAFAQETETGGDTGLSAFLGRITLFADRIGRSLMDVESHITVVEGDEIRDRGVLSIEDFTRLIPGIEPVRQVSAADPFGGQTGFEIRGVSGNRVLTLVDGARVPERIIDGSRDYADFNFTKQIDVVRGPASVLWGADALGGVVAVETIDAEDLIEPGRMNGGRVTLGYGSLTDATNVAASFAQRFGDNVTLMFAQSRTTDHEMELSNARDDGGIWGCTRPVEFGGITCGEFNPLDRTSDRTLVKLGWDINPTNTLTFVFDHLDRKSEVETLYAIGPTSSGGYLFENPRTRDIERTRYALEYQGQFGGFIDEVKATLSYSPSGYDQVALRIEEMSSGDIRRQYDYTDFHEDFLELDIQATSRFSIGVSDHVLTFGFDGDHTATSYFRNRRIVNVTAGTDTSSVPTSWNFADGTTTRADVFIQDNITLLGGQLEVTPGLRFATYRMDPEFNESVVDLPGYELETRTEERILASLGATWRFNDTYSAWAHFGQGFKMPTFQQLYTSSGSATFGLVPAPDLVPEEVESFEIGVRGEYADGFWSLNAYHASYDNFIESFWNIPGTSDYSYRNLSSVETWGIELEAGWQATDQLQLTGAIAWQDGRQRATDGAPETRHVVPPLSAVLGASYEIPQYGLNLNMDLIMVGEAKPESSANFKPPAYAVVDVGASWEFAENAMLNLSVNNLFDERYFLASAANYSATPGVSVDTNPLELQTGPGRNVSLTLDYKF